MTDSSIVQSARTWNAGTCEFECEWEEVKPELRLMDQFVSVSVLCVCFSFKLSLRLNVFTINTHQMCVCVCVSLCVAIKILPHSMNTRAHTHCWEMRSGSASCASQGLNLHHQLADIQGPWCVIGWQHLQGPELVSCPRGPNSNAPTQNAVWIWHKANTRRRKWDRRRVQERQLQHVINLSQTVDLH